jgi:uncharacterized membrane protein
LEVFVLFAQSIFWLWFSGLVFLFVGLFMARKELSSGSILDKLMALGPVLIAASLAVFGAEHMVSAQFIKAGVPKWMPAPLFWAYFVGFALLCTAASFVLRRYVRLSATLYGAMVFSFVALIHIPNAIQNPRDRLIWAVVLRDTAFAGGAWAFAGSLAVNVKDRWPTTQILIGRICVAAAVIFFAVEHFLHPEFAPGVPLAKQTPAWVPLIPFWGYLTGAVSLIAGICLLLKIRARTGAALLGLLMIFLTLFLYVPILALAPQQSLVEAVNYVFDTLLFAGTLLVVAQALPDITTASP